MMIFLHKMPSKLPLSGGEYAMFPFCYLPKG